ncbi:MAG: nicotinate-nicotinamide nucleotide adenylyltransferase [Methylotenera sp.]|nr:nicotinate-nicotinamide nucleotide adenylyltransferase [Oligoflexia bacterium]
MKQSWNDITAIFGGTFDPPHLGHREAVRGLFQYPGVKKVVILPAGNPPLKTSRTTAEDRVAMARLCFSATPRSRYPEEIEFDLREVKRSQSWAGNPGEKSYTYDTLAQLRTERTHTAFVIGTDQLEKLPQWHRFPDILKLTHWIVLERKPKGRERSLAALQPLESSRLIRPVSSDTWKIAGSATSASNGETLLKLVPTDAPLLSSSEIRETLTRTGKPPEGSLFDPVLSYLNEHRLYGTQ